MKKLIYFLFFFLFFEFGIWNFGFGISASAQTAGCIKADITYNDTVLNKVFFTWSINVPDMYEKKVAVNMFVYLSKGSIHNMSKTIAVPEIPNYFEIDCSADGLKTWNDIADPVFIRNLIRSKLKDINATWQNADFIWY